MLASAIMKDVFPAREDRVCLRLERLKSGAKWGKNVRLLACGPIGTKQKGLSTLDVKPVVAARIARARQSRKSLAAGPPPFSEAGYHRGLGSPGRTRLKPVMSGEAPFCRVRPSEIRLRETHESVAELGSGERTRLRGAARGLIEVVVPYDGSAAFSRAAARDVELGSAAVGRSARIGNLVLGGSEGTDLDARFGLAARYGSLPLELPLAGPGLESPAALVSDRCSAVLRLAYEPASAAPEALVVTARLSDEECLSAELLERLAHGDRACARALVPELTLPAGFRGQVLLEFELELLLPKRIEGAGAGGPRLQRLALEWPATSSPRGVGARLRDGHGELRPLPVRIDPRTRRIECGALDFLPPHAPEADTGLFRYTLPTVQFVLHEPDELQSGAVEKNELEGELEVVLPGLLSKLVPRFHDATGHGRPEVPLRSSTVFASRLRLSVAELVERRAVSPYRQLRFEGVLPERARLAEIQDVLTQRGFAARAIPLAADGSDTDSGFLFGRLQAASGPLDLLVCMQGARTRTLRRTQLAGGPSDTTELVSGHTLVHLRGQARGERVRLLEELNALQVLLEERFRHVSTSG